MTRPLAAAALLLSACLPGTKSDLDRSSYDGADDFVPVDSDVLVDGGTFADDVWPLLADRCASCHAQPDTPPAMRDVQDLEQLVDQPATVEGKVYVIPFDGGNSYLYQKVTGQHLVGGGAGAQMPPYPEAPLDDAEVRRLYAWIADGAAP